MIFTLHKYIFRELMKIFLLSAVALTIMMSLGSILRPVQEFGVGPGQVIDLIGYFLPVTLTFVLPIAALFAAALVYGRFASDNELDACRASGISLVTLVYPGFALAIIVAIANLIFSFYVVPAFIQRAEKAVKADAKQIIFRNIQRKGYYKVPDGKFIIYADNADLKNSTISGVVIIEIKGEKIQKIITTENAKVEFDSHRKFNEVQILAHNTYQMGSADELWFFSEWLPFSAEFPPLMGDSVKFKKIDKMKEIMANPISFSPIEKLARETYAQFAAELLANDITSVFQNNDKFYKLYSGQILVKFTAAQCIAEGEKKVALSGDVEAIEYDADGNEALRTIRCKNAMLLIDGDEFSPTLTMEFRGAAIWQPDGSESLAGRIIYRGLILPKAVTDKLKTADVLETIKPNAVLAALGREPSSQLKALQQKLWYRIHRTQVEIGGEINSRLVFGIGCLPMVLIGIGLGIIKKGGHLLTAFGASCVPAAVLIVCIMMGRNIVKNPQSQAGSGILLMWAGVIFLIFLTLIIYRKLLKS
jgi:lipopolysaccharide export system permease protein